MPTYEPPAQPDSGRSSAMRCGFWTSMAARCGISAAVLMGPGSGTLPFCQVHYDYLSFGLLPEHLDILGRRPL
jgi:hypothetical protein